jgi:hypothetical protein
MAKQYGSYMGGFSGKLGPAVGYRWNGIWVLRSRPEYVRNPRTEAQMRCRNRFKASVQLAAAMRMAVAQGFTAIAREHGMTAYNVFVSANQPCFDMRDGQFVVDWRRLSLSEGPVAPVLFGVPSVDERNVLSVSFDRNGGARMSRPHDYVYLYVYCPELQDGLLAAPVYRRDRAVRLMLPETFVGRELLLYGFVQDDKGVGSTTCFIGWEAEENTAVDSVPTNGFSGVYTNNSGTPAAAAPDAGATVDAETVLRE